MPLVFPSTGLTITNPLVLYRTLLATRQIEADPAQHRLAIHLQKLYHRLKDYHPEVDFSYRLSQLNKLVEKTPLASGTFEETGSKDNGRANQSLWPRWQAGKEATQVTALTRTLTDHESALQVQSPQGLLLYGEVGTGKSLLVDLLADCLPNRKKRRWHFNTFMLDMFARLEALRKSRLQVPVPKDVYPEEHSLLCLARDLISTSPILFLDEFQLPDRTASKILSSLFISFFQLGGVLIATSNRMPEELANASGIEFGAPPTSGLGLLRGRWGLLGNGKQQGKSENMFSGKGDFAAFLDVLRARCEIWDIEGGKDWRRREAQDATTQVQAQSTQSEVEVDSLEPLSAGKNGLGYEQNQYVRPSDKDQDTETLSASTNPMPEQYFMRRPESPRGDDWVNLEMRWKEREVSAVRNTDLENKQSFGVNIPWKTASLCIYGRSLSVPRQHAGVTKWRFDEICGANLGPADYISLASTFHTFILTDIPVLTLPQKNEARRLITLLDALYEARCKLLISADAGPDGIFFPETRPLSRDGVKLDTQSSPLLSAADDGVYPETFSEIYQDQTSPFRPNISSYEPSASPPSYANSPVPTSASQISAARSILADEDSDFGPVRGASRTHGVNDRAIGACNDIGRQISPDFARTGAFIGEDEKFAYKRARSRLWEMCGSKWWAREGDWWKPLSKEVRRWEGVAEAPQPTNHALDRNESLFRHGASPFRTSQEPPPKFSWTHAWGMMTWGKRAGAWGKGPEGLQERKHHGTQTRNVNDKSA